MVTCLTPLASVVPMVVDLVWISNGNVINVLNKTFDSNELIDCNFSRKFSGSRTERFSLSGHVQWGILFFRSWSCWDLIISILELIYHAILELHISFTHLYIFYILVKFLTSSISSPCSPSIYLFFMITTNFVTRTPLDRLFWITNFHRIIFITKQKIPNDKKTTTLFHLHVRRSQTLHFRTSSIKG